ncbi:sulfotransferase family protein [Nocardioides sp. Kera G14]|uniref:sulfotransferase family protein n=1 Tax=Nocardioides sp. Kera G14 TaxID=2884264 RepID=UPI001D10B96F|nr:sulfotransferase [Nocardioides sp. Kera G14]UDY24554.1 sulfotransferase [Nocardioides sp. Kera G14]
MTPNLLIAGVQKAGTTWLHSMLAEHPDFAMSKPKELNHLRTPEARFHEGWDDYLRHWAGRSERFRGESTPHYFWAPDPVWGPKGGINVARRVAEHLDPEAQVIVILRDPVSRAVSSYWHQFSRGRFDPSTTGILRAPAHWGIVDLGFYSRHYAQWAGELGAERVHVLLYDDLVSDPDAFLRQALTVLGARVDVPEFWDVIDVHARVHDKSWVKEFRAAHDPVTEAEIAALVEIYRDEVAWVESHLGRSLPAWSDREALITKHAHSSGEPGPWVADPATVPEWQRALNRERKRRERNAAPRPSRRD